MRPKAPTDGIYYLHQMAQRGNASSPQTTRNDYRTGVRKQLPLPIAMYVAFLLGWGMQRLFGTFPNRRRGFGAADSAAGGGCGPGIGRTALSRTGDRSTVGALADSRSFDRGGLVHAPGGRIGGAGFSVLFLGLPRTGIKRAHDRYTGCHRIVRCGCLFGRCQALWKAQVGVRAPAR